MRGWRLLLQHSNSLILPGLSPVTPKTRLSVLHAPKSGT